MFAVIYIPDFALQSALRHEPEVRDKPVALLEEVGGGKIEGRSILASDLALHTSRLMPRGNARNGSGKSLPKALVFQMSDAARRAGVTEGLTSTQAMARCAEILVRNRSLAQENSATAALLHCAYGFSPNIESTAPGICTLDLQGLSLGTQRSNGARECWNAAEYPNTPPLHHSVRGNDWSEKILSQLDLLHLRAQIGIAETPGLARHAARQARPVLFVEDADEFLSALPIESICPSAEILRVLKKWGIRTLGAFVALGKDKVAERLGAEALDLFELATARAIRPLKLVTPPETFEESIDFPNEIDSLQPLLFILRRFVDQIGCRLELAGLAAEELLLRLTLSSGDLHERPFRVPAPTSHADTLFRMLHTHLETVRTEAPIVALHLSARPCRSRNHQFDLFETSLRDPNQFHETLARLTALLGPNRAGTPVIESTHRPDAFHMENADFDSGWRNEPLLTRPGGHPLLSFRRRGEGRGEERFPVPRIRSEDFLPALASLAERVPARCALALRRFRPPIHADVEKQNGVPVFISTLKFTSPIHKAMGPWRKSGDWWDTEKLWQREEWDVQTRDGALYRIYEEERDWFLEGRYD